MIYGSEDKIQDLYSSLKDELVEYLLKTKCSNDYPQCEDFVKTQIDRSNSSYERYRNTKTRKKKSRAYCESSPLKVQAVIIRFRIPLNNFLKK